MRDVDDVRGISLAAIHALTNAAMLLGVPLLAGRRLVRHRPPRANVPRSTRPLATAAASALVAAGLTIATRQFAWALVRLWLRMDIPAGERSSSRTLPPQ